MYASMTTIMDMALYALLFLINQSLPILSVIQIGGEENDSHNLTT